MNRFDIALGKPAPIEKPYKEYHSPRKRKKPDFNFGLMPSRGPGPDLGTDPSADAPSPEDRIWLNENRVFGDDIISIPMTEDRYPVTIAAIRLCRTFLRDRTAKDVLDFHYNNHYATLSTTSPLTEDFYRGHRTLRLGLPRRLGSTVVANELLLEFSSLPQIAILVCPTMDMVYNARDLVNYGAQRIGAMHLLNHIFVAQRSFETRIRGMLFHVVIIDGESVMTKNQIASIYRATIPANPLYISLG
jgi:hypothetical protein